MQSHPGTSSEEAAGVVCGQGGKRGEAEAIVTKLGTH